MAAYKVFGEEGTATREPQYGSGQAVTRFANPVQRLVESVIDPGPVLLRYLVKAGSIAARVKTGKVFKHPVCLLTHAICHCRTACQAWRCVSAASPGNLAEKGPTTWNPLAVLDRLFPADFEKVSSEPLTF